MTRDGYHRAQAAYDAAEPEDGERVECPRCGGTGSVSWSDGTYEVWLECTRCEGDGMVRSSEVRR